MQYAKAGKISTFDNDGEELMERYISKNTSKSIGAELEA